MALIFGVAMMLGTVVNANGDAGSAAVIAAGLIVLAVILPRSRAMLAATALLGFGVALMLTDGGHDATILPTNSVLPEEISGTIQTDPRLGSSGATAWLGWRAGDGSAAETLLIYPASIQTGRGDRVLARGEWLPLSNELFLAEELVIEEEAGGLEPFRQRLRATATQRVLRSTPGSNGSLALGLIIGDDSGLTGDERDAMRTSGLSHITAVSGSNVALVIVVVGYLLRALNRRGWMWLLAQLAGVSGYVWIVGADPPIVRAAIMGSLALIAWTLGRPSHLYTLLFLAGGLMCVQDPAVLSSLAFQLSFTAMIGLALAGDLISKVSGVGRKVVTALMSPVGAALLTAPLIAGTFGTVSPGTIPANLMVAPLVGPATALAGLVAAIPDSIPIGGVLGLALWVMTGLMLRIAEVVAGLPFAIVSFAPLSNAQIMALYALLAALAAPLIPEVRLLAFRLRGWVAEEPVVALVSGSSGLLMALTLIFAVD